MTTCSTSLELVIRGAGASADLLALTVEDAVRSALPDSDITVVKTGSLALSTRAVRRVKILDVGSEAAADRYVSDAVARPRDVIVLSAGLRVSGGWCEEIVRRMGERPDRAAMLRLGHGYLVAAPRSVTVLSSVDTLWRTVPGVAPTADAGRGLLDEAITAVIIAKDEAPIIGACVASASAFVKEVLVYDTGSSDGTQEIATLAGARVVQGYWDDDFAGARNRAADCSSTDWIMVVDADDVVVGDPTAARAYLNSAGTDIVDGPQVSVTPQGVETCVVNTARFFRRSRYHYQGAVHENVVPRIREDVESRGDCSHLVRFLHSGYTDEAMVRGDKARRNLELARKALASSATGSAGHARHLAEVGRALALMGDETEALQLMSSAISQTSSPHLVVTCGRLAVSLLLAREDDEEAARWISALERAGECSGRLALSRAQLLLMRGDRLGALSEVRPFADGSRVSTDLWDVPNPRGDAQRLRIALEHDTGNHPAARASLLEFLSQEDGGVPLALLMVVLQGDPVELMTAAVTANATFRRLSVVEALQGSAIQGLPWIAALRTAHPDDSDVLAAGCRLSSQVGWREALQWTVEAVSAGADHCPLRDLGLAGSAPLMDRCMALAWLSDGGQNASVVRQLFDALELAAPDVRMDVLSTIELHLPGLLDHLTARSA